jgi:RNA polymerase sigma-70 factor (ECF subfamily)
MPETSTADTSQYNDTLLLPIVLRAKQGDEDAFGELYSAYFEKIFRFVFFRVSHKEVAEDITEDVFIKAWQKISTVKAESFGGWLYQIARNKIIDHYRQEKTTVDLVEVENLLEAPDDLADDANQVLNQELFIQLLRQLTPEQQVIVKLKFLEDLDNSEIAELIAKSEGSIRVIQHRAIQKLQQLLDEHTGNSKKIRE